MEKRTGALAVLFVLLFLPEASGADGLGVGTHRAPLGLPISTVTTLPATLEKLASQNSTEGFIEVSSFHFLAGTTISSCGALISGLIEAAMMAWAPLPLRPPPLELVLVPMGVGVGTSLGLWYAQLAFPEYSPIVSEVRFGEKRFAEKQLLRFSSPEMRTQVRENLKRLPKLDWLDVRSASAVFQLDLEGICKRATLVHDHERLDLAAPLQL